MEGSPAFAQNPSKGQAAILILCQAAGQGKRSLWLLRCVPARSGVLVALMLQRGRDHASRPPPARMLEAASGIDARQGSVSQSSPVSRIETSARASLTPGFCFAFLVWLGASMPFRQSVLGLPIGLGLGLVRGSVLARGKPRSAPGPAAREPE